jgi:N utilization substance protein B
MARRSKAREVAVQMLYQIDLNPSVDLRAVRNQVDELLADPDLREFAWRLVVGVRENQPLLDSKIQAVAENWSVKRMAPTDRNVLRLGLYELLNTPTPHRVVLDEAIELARVFGSAQSAQFVNGVLDKLVPAEKRDTRPGETT